MRKRTPKDPPLKRIFFFMAVCFIRSSLPSPPPPHLTEAATTADWHRQHYKKQKQQQDTQTFTCSTSKACFSSFVCFCPCQSLHFLKRRTSKGWNLLVRSSVNCGEGAFCHPSTTPLLGDVESSLYSLCSLLFSRHHTPQVLTRYAAYGDGRQYWQLWRGGGLSVEVVSNLWPNDFSVWMSIPLQMTLPWIDDHYLQPLFASWTGLSERLQIMNISSCQTYNSYPRILVPWEHLLSSTGLRFAPGWGQHHSSQYHGWV